MTDNLREKFINELQSRETQKMVSLWILERIPYIFQEDRSLFIDWKMTLANQLGVDSASILIVGSGCVGISLNPHKNFKLFDNDSDIDVAIVSDYHFNEAWRTLRNLGSGIHKLPQKMKQNVLNHVSNYIYWGTIATDNILPLMPFSKIWTNALKEMANISPTNNKTVNARIYKDFESLRSYHLRNLNLLKLQSLSTGEDKNVQVLADN